MLGLRAAWTARTFRRPATCGTVARLYNSRMRAPSFVIWITAVLLAQAAAAHADGARLVSGGPSDEAGRREAVRSLNQVSESLRVCFRGERPEAVTVEISVDRDGRVVLAKQATKGPVAQCVAGVLAVQTLAASSTGYKASVSLATGDSKARTIDEALAQERAKLEACRPDGEGKGGQATVKFLIQPDGRMTDVSIQRATLQSDAVSRCLVNTLKAGRLVAGLTDKPVSYSLTVDFAAGGASQPTSPTVADPALQPKKEGPMEGAAISAVMDQRKRDFAACYERQARKNRSLAGRVVLRFTIRGDGAVSNVQVRETTLNDAAVETCIADVGKTLKFPGEPGRKDTRVWYPFAFTAR